MKNIKHYFKGFTLVELIIVITILSILATIAFVSFQNYFGDARDANRVSTLKNIENGLSLFQIKSGMFPTPDIPKIFTGGLDGNTQINQGIIGESISKIISMNTVPLDPKEKTPYVYSTFGKNNIYYQVGIDSENTQTSLLPQVYAKSKSSIVRGNYRFDPSLPSLIVVENEALTNSGIFSPDICFVIDHGKNTFKNCNEKKSEMSLKEYDNALVGYWDMESITSDGKLKDLSGNANHGAFGGITKPQSVHSIFGTAYYFGTGSNDISKNNSGFIQVPDSQLLTKFPNGLTITTLVKTNIPSPGAFIMLKSGKKVNSVGFMTGSVNDSNKIHWYNWGMYISSEAVLNDNLSLYAVNKKVDILANIYDVTIGIWQSGSHAVMKEIGKIFLPDGNYHLITMSVDGLGDTRKLYFDGVLMHTYNIKHPDMINKGIDERPGDLLFGANKDNTNGILNSSYYNFNGMIDEVKIYNRVLSDTEVVEQAKIAGF